MFANSWRLEEAFFNILVILIFLLVVYLYYFCLTIDFDDLNSWSNRWEFPQDLQQARTEAGL
ncbi:hypothetical protein ACL6C3_15075 [Capilliphycus salinus ALCB114379]|uniref:hypothetical protein n=1 Tax=Capilliphycus salinus TaxID=2768948 RepID=UPI0039A43B18